MRPSAGSPRCCRGTTPGSWPSGSRRGARGSTWTGPLVWSRIMEASSWLILKASSPPRDRELPTRRPVPVRIMDWGEVYEETDTAMLRRAGPAAAWTCGIPFCHNGLARSET